MFSTDFSGEFIFSSSRSSGAGGQNVNKVNTKVELRFDVVNSKLLTQTQKDLICVKLKNKITDDGFLILVSQVHRSQLQNKETVIEKFYKLLEKAFAPVKPRKATKPTKASKAKRLEGKLIVSIKKSNRKRILPE